jgi:hypothetical protein
MGEMTLDEAKEIIGQLSDLIEECIVFSAAYKAVLSVEGKPGWEEMVEYVQEKFRPVFGELIFPLREILRGASVVQRSEIDWHQIVRSLIESAGSSDLAE